MCHSYWITTWDGVPEQLSELRQYLHQTLGDEADGVDDVVLVASELAGNAVLHSRSGEPGGAFTLQVVALSDAWHVRIDDQGSRCNPGHKATRHTDETGRGLPVVAALARAWGTFGSSAGRTVWAEVAYPRDDVVVEFWEGEGTGVLTPVVADGVLRSLEASALQVIVGEFLG
jgi:anti-sigma regulatory factor (Ser/Thr protein kinase)